MKKLLCGVGIRDCATRINSEKIILKSENTWKNMIRRCYDSKAQNYKYYGGSGVTVCEEWKRLSNFRKWFLENYIEGYSLDKDFKSNGDVKIYSPETCSFVSRSENTLESNSRTNYDLIRGKNNHNYKEKEYYSTKANQRANFKKYCKRQGWNFEDFEELETGIKQSNGAKLYFYKIRRF